MLEHEFRDTLAERMGDHAREHWTEFAVIIAGANVFLAVILTGAALGQHQPDVAHVLGTAIAVASSIGVLLSYYSITVGSYTAFGPLTPLQVVASFLLAASQITLFLWPIHVLQSDSHKSSIWIEDRLHWWLAAEAAFCYAAVIANAVEAGARRRVGVSKALSLGMFDAAQRTDRIMAGLCGTVLLAGAAVGAFLRHAEIGVTLGGALVATIGMSAAIAAQGRASRSLLATVAWTPASKPD